MEAAQPVAGGSSNPGQDASSTPVFTSAGPGVAAATSALKRESEESIEPPERQAQLLVTLIASVILVMVFSLIIYRMVSDKAAEAPRLQSGTSTARTFSSTVLQRETPATSRQESTMAAQTSAGSGSTGEEGKMSPVSEGSSATSAAMLSGGSQTQLADKDVIEGWRGRMNRRRHSSARELVCVVTEMTTQRDQYPPGYCSHLVYSDVVFDPKHRKFLATKNDKSFELFCHNQRTSNLSHVVALNPHQTLNVYLTGLTDLEVQWYFVQAIESLRNDYHFDGVAFIGIELSLDNIQQFSRVIGHLKEALKKKPSRQLLQTIFGGFINDIDKEPSEVASRVRVIADEVDIFILETHYQKPLPLCKTVFPSALKSYGSYTPSMPINTALTWMREIQNPRFAKSKGSICISLSMVALLFKISGTVDHLTPGNPCSEEIWMNYAETCIGHGWSNVKTHPAALASFRHKIKFWQSFDTDVTAAKKVDLLLDGANTTCLAAYYVDYEDYYGMCQGKIAFPRLKAIREQLNKRTNLDEDIDLFGHDF